MLRTLHAIFFLSLALLPACVLKSMPEILQTTLELAAVITAVAIDAVEGMTILRVTILLPSVSAKRKRAGMKLCILWSLSETVAHR